MLFRVEPLPAVRAAGADVLHIDLRLRKALAQAGGEDIDVTSLGLGGVATGGNGIPETDDGHRLAGLEFGERLWNAPRRAGGDGLRGRFDDGVDIIGCDLGGAVIDEDVRDGGAAGIGVGRHGRADVRLRLA